MKTDLPSKRPDAQGELAAKWVQNILILQRSKSLPANLREAIRQQGFSSHTVFDVDSALAALKELPHPLLLMDCGENRQLAAQAIKHVIDTPEVCDYPAIIVAPQPQEFNEAFNRYFILFRALEAPSTAVQIMQAVNELNRDYPEYVKHLARVAPGKITAAVKEAPPPPVPIARRAAADIPGELITQITSPWLRSINLEGHLYGRQVDSALLAEKGCLPANTTVRRAADDLCRALGEMNTQHLYRAAFVNGQTSKALNLDPSHKEAGAGAVFLFASGFLEANPDLLRVNYLSPRGRARRKEIGAVVKESAHHAEDLDLPEVGAVIYKLAQLIEQTAPPADDPQSLAASTIMAADLLDRSVYHHGYWDPQAAYLFLVNIRNGALAEIHPSIVPCLVKLVVESVRAKRPAYLMPKYIRTNPAAMAALRREREAKISRQERRVEITSLIPGMKVTRPVTAPDGTVLLPEGLTLDADLIWRIWQLATMKIVCTPVIVAAEDLGKK